MFSRGSSYRFSGRTQKQIIEATQEHARQQPSFNRLVLLNGLSELFKILVKLISE